MYIEDKFAALRKRVEDKERGYQELQQHFSRFAKRVMELAGWAQKPVRGGALSLEVDSEQRVIRLCVFDAGEEVRELWRVRIKEDYAFSNGAKEQSQEEALEDLLRMLTGALL